MALIIFFEMFEDKPNRLDSEKHSENQQQKLSNFGYAITSPSKKKILNYEVLDFDSKSFLQLNRSSVSYSFGVKCKHLSRSCMQTCDKSINYSVKTNSDMSFDGYSIEESPNHIWLASEAVTSAKGSFFNNEKKKETLLLENYATFAVPSRMFCLSCDKEVFTIVSFQLIDPGFWDWLEKIINSFRCCENAVSEKEKQQILVDLRF